MSIVTQPLPGTVQMPPGQWIPNDQQITDSSAGLLAVCVAALDQYGLTEQFERKLFTHGDVVPIPRGESVVSQLIVTFNGLELGNPGRKQFTIQAGDIGSFAHMTGAFTVHVWMPWPTPKGGIAPMLAASRDIMEAAVALNQVGFVLFSALRALSLDGVRVNPPVTPIRQDGIMVGPMKPTAHQGGMAGWTIDVQLQYS